MGSFNPLKSTPVSIIFGAAIIAFAVLLSGGVVTFSKNTAGKTVISFGKPAGSLGQPQILPPASAQPQAGEVAGAEVSVDPLQERDHIRGERLARVLLIEYSDLECPFCKRFHPTAQKAVDEYKGEVAWVYRHFPLDQIHSKADKEAEAVECAAELGGEDGFWKLTGKIYEVTPSNNGLNLDDLPKLAGEVGLDQAKFKTCLDSGKYASRVEEDYQSGIKAGVQGTPGNILLDTKTGKTVSIPGAVPFESLKSSIDSLLKS